MPLQLVSGVSIGAIRAQAAERLVGRDRELDLVLSAVSAGCDILLEGPPGTSKTTMLKAITGAWGVPLMFVEANDDLTVAKLVGHHDPVRVLREDYTPQNFVAGPLVEAMRSGGFLYIEELNRAPEDALNALLGAIAEREIVIPRVGTVAATPTFRLIASMNPYDSVGTHRLSASIYDRLCRLGVGYQDADSEVAIVALRATVDLTVPLEAQLAADAVAVTRATREHRDVRAGSSVRGAIDTVRVARELMALKHLADANDDRYASLFFDAVVVGLSGRLALDDAADTTPEAVLWEICEEILSRRVAPG